MHTKQTALAPRCDLAAQKTIRFSSCDTCSSCDIPCETRKKISAKLMSPYMTPYIGVSVEQSQFQTWMQFVSRTRGLLIEHKWTVSESSRRPTSHTRRSVPLSFLTTVMYVVTDVLRSRHRYVAYFFPTWSNPSTPTRLSIAITSVRRRDRRCGLISRHHPPYQHYTRCHVSVALDID